MCRNFTDNWGRTEIATLETSEYNFLIQKMLIRYLYPESDLFSIEEMIICNL